jgi:DNA uptake protein ComE-like DNA-binding protein
MEKTRINLANPQELCELPGIDHTKRDAILRHRAQNGPIKDASELAEIVGRDAVTPALLEHVDFAPAETTAPEAPGA